MVFQLAFNFLLVTLLVSYLMPLLSLNTICSPDEYTAVVLMNFLPAAVILLSSCLHLTPLSSELHEEKTFFLLKMGWV
jgi:uncharacterized MnhB-related membrane protein